LGHAVVAGDQARGELEACEQVLGGPERTVQVQLLAPELLGALEAALGLRQGVCVYR
jgi:hypothetical protein